MAIWNPEILNLAIVAKVRESLGLPSGEVLLATRDGYGYALVPHVTDVWKLPIEDSCPGQDAIPALAPRLASPSDASDILAVDWLTDQGRRTGSTVMMLTEGRRVRLAPAEDGGAFAGNYSTYADWIRTPGTPRGFAALASADRLQELAQIANANEESFLDWLDELGDYTDPGYCDWCSKTYSLRLDALIEGRVRV